MEENGDNSVANNCHILSASNPHPEQQIEELHSTTSGQSHGQRHDNHGEVNNILVTENNSEKCQGNNEPDVINNETMELVNNLQFVKGNRSLRCRHLHEIKQLKSENINFKNEFNQLKTSNIRIEVKNKRFNQLMSENDRLKNELMFSQKINEILVKIKKYYETAFEKLVSDNYSENENILNNLLNEYNRILNESQTDLKYKLITNKSRDEYNSCGKRTSFQSINAKRSRGRPSKQKTLKRLARIENSSLENQTKTNELQSISKKLKMSFRCEWPDCSYQCSRTKVLTEHINSAHTGERPYKCPLNDCLKSFSRSNTLDVHIKSCHSDERRFKCNWEGCEAALKTKLGLSIHLQRHSGEKQFKCEWEGCAYKGMTKQRLDIHYMNHTGQRPFKCNWPGCGSNFTSSDCLRSHQKSHSNLRPFVCDWPGCDSAFKANRALSIHKVIHTNENLFKCNSCEFSCNRYHILASHRLNHTGGRKFPCSWPGCDSKFDRRNKLELHLMIHRGDKPHKCPFDGCDKRFVEKGNMRKHFNSIHSKTKRFS